MIKVRSIHTVVFAAFAFLLAWMPLSAQVPSKQSVRVLYIEGSKDTLSGNAVDPARGADFREFLQRYFVSVQSCKDTDFTVKASNDADVIVVDGDIADRLPAAFRRPMILLGGDYAPLKVAERRGYKLHNA